MLHHLLWIRSTIKLYVYPPRYLLCSFSFLSFRLRSFSAYLPLTPTSPLPSCIALNYTCTPRGIYYVPFPLFCLFRRQSSSASSLRTPTSPVPSYNIKLYVCTPRYLLCPNFLFFRVNPPDHVFTSNSTGEPRGIYFVRFPYFFGRHRSFSASSLRTPTSPRLTAFSTCT